VKGTVCVGWGGRRGVGVHAAGKGNARLLLLVLRMDVGTLLLFLGGALWVCYGAALAYRW
jgi:hypothetical protein